MTKPAAEYEPVLTRLSDVKPRKNTIVRYDTRYGVPSFDLKRSDDDWYEIEASRCNTAAKLVGWIAHLSQKTWVTTDHIEYLIELVAREFPKVVVRGF